VPRVTRVRASFRALLLRSHRLEASDPGGTGIAIGQA
jgi:hypothetical protein